MSTGGGTPAVLYGVRFNLDGAVYEIRAARSAATVALQEAEDDFALYACELVCTESARLSGGISTAGPEVRVAVPLEALSATAGAELTNVEAWTALGEGMPGPLIDLDALEG